MPGWEVVVVFYFLGQAWGDLRLYVSRLASNSVCFFCSSLWDAGITGVPHTTTTTRVLFSLRPKLDNKMEETLTIA